MMRWRKSRLWPAVMVLCALSAAFSGGGRMLQRSSNEVAAAGSTSPTQYRTGWTQLSPKTQLRKVCPPPKYGYEFPANCKNVIAAWSGGIADVAHNRMILWGGGHTDYYGNELYALNLGDETMVRLNDPGPVADPAANQVALSNGTPNSRHTYGGLAYIAHADRMFVFGGDPAATFGFASNDTWTLDLSTLQWQRMDPVTGGSPAHAFGVVSDYDPNTRTVYLHDGQTFWQYTYETNTYRSLDSSSTITIYNSAVIDPRRKLFFIIGGQAPNTPNSNVIQVVDISAQSKHALQNWKTTGCGPLPSAGYPGVAYDPVLDRVVGWAGGNTVYIFNPDTKTCTTTSPPDGPGAPQNNGTNGRFRYFPSIDAFVLVNDASQNAFVLKLSPEAAVNDVTSLRDRR